MSSITLEVAVAVRAMTGNPAHTSPCIDRTHVLSNTDSVNND